VGSWDNEDETVEDNELLSEFLARHSHNRISMNEATILVIE